MTFLAFPAHLGSEIAWDPSCGRDSGSFPRGSSEVTFKGNQDAVDPV